VKELTVISGKGGTGKTSLVASFAALARNTIVADCDVDAADLHLVLAPQVVKKTPFVGGLKAHIDPESCTGCATCADLCRFEAVAAQGPPNAFTVETYTIDPIACEGCGVCAHFCDAEAITLKDAVQGEWFVSETRHGPMVHARLGIAAENSGKLVSIIRAAARQLAEEHGEELVIVDGSPGIGCPVIASVTGCHLVMVVTEPTLSGVHDLERVIGLAEHFSIPAAVVINKHDLNPEITGDVMSWCREKGVLVAGKIPYSPDFVQAMVASESVVEMGDGPAADAIKQIWRKTAGLLGLDDQSGVASMVRDPQEHQPKTL